MLKATSSIADAKQGTASLQFSRFSTPGGAEECYIAVSSTNRTASLEQTLGEMLDGYDACLAEYGLSDNTVAFTRFYFSDITNQIAEVTASPLFARIKA